MVPHAGTRKMVPVSGACVTQSDTEFFGLRVSVTSLEHFVISSGINSCQQATNGHCYRAYFCLAFGCKQSVNIIIMLFSKLFNLFHRQLLVAAIKQAAVIAPVADYFHQPC